MARNGTLSASVALLCVLSLLLSAGLLAAVTPAADLGGDGGGDGGDGNGQQGEGRRGEGQQGDGQQPGRSGEPVGGGSSMDPTSVGSTPGPGHLTNGTGAVVLSFTVHAERGEYFRFVAYDRYSGVGWHRPTNSSDYDGRLATPPGNSTRLVQHYRAERPVAVMPVAWKPVAVPARDADVARVTALGGLEPDRPLLAGERYTVVSRVPNATPAELRNATGDPPPTVEQRYTALPADTPDRVGALSRNVTANATGPYEAAVAVQEWLRAEKRFSLDVAAPDDHVADAFLFEMEAGYCEYYATAMTVMLRSQGVPARYVVGYTDGVAVGEDTYRLYSAYTHAWVEVYVAGVGWVRFDPTPQGARAAAGGRAVDARTPAEPRRPPDADRLGSDPSYVAPYTAEDDDRVGDGRTPTPDERNRTLPGDYAVALGRDPVPGAPVLVTVTEDGDPAPGVVVLFNGRAVGTTNESGQVTATVPYAERLVVNLSVPGRPRVAALGGQALDAGPSRAGMQHRRTGRVGRPGLQLERAGSQPRRPAGRPRPAAAPPGDNSSRVYDLNTTVALALTGTPRAGTEVTVAAAVEGVPVRAGRVAVDGAVVARTGADGTATLSLPYRDAVTVSVVRGAATGETRLDVLPALNVSLAGHAVPGRSTTVVVRRHGDPVPGAAVRVDGEAVGTTGPRGRLRVAVPHGLSMGVAVRRGEAYGERTVPLVGWYLLPVAAVVALGAGRRYRAGARTRRAASGLYPRLVRVARAVAALVPVAAERALAATVALAVAAGRLLDAAAAAARRALVRLPELLASPQQIPGAVVAALRTLWRWLGCRVAAVAALLAAAAAGAAAGAADGAGGTGGATGRAAGDGDDRALSVYRAWREMVRLLPVPVERTDTPSEIARRAVENGVPQDPVYALTAAFRDVRYGGRESTDDRVGRVRQALAAVRRWVDRRRER